MPKFCLILLLLSATALAETAEEKHQQRVKIPASVFIHDPKHGNVRMGVKSDDCDNGETNLEYDWDGRSDRAFACTPERRRQFDAANSARLAKLGKAEFHLNEVNHLQHHVCSIKPIAYAEPLPTSGGHRPLWPVWGQYEYVPPQRWLHSLEHGGIVGLYHPCTPADQVRAFVSVIAGCLRRHVVGADAERLQPDMPFALLAHRNKVLMANFNASIVRDFILSHALKGPERIALPGQYHLGLIREATIVSDSEDSQLCPS